MVRKPEFSTGIKPETLENKTVTLVNRPQKILLLLIVTKKKITNCYELYLFLVVLGTIHLNIYFRITRFLLER